VTLEATGSNDIRLCGEMLRRGALVEPAPPRILQAGPLSLLFEGDSLRYIRLGDREIVRRIYCAVRDRNWATIPNRVDDFRARVAADSFDIDFDVRNVEGEIDFRWHGRITGAAEGTIDFEMEGVAQRTFWRNRVGFCVLHPIEGCAGEKCIIVGPDGAGIAAEFPRFIAPENPFREMTGIVQPLSPGVSAQLSFRGDLFEMEDQRNWTDASFKTFCTPLRLPFPAKLHAGDRVAQRVTLRIVRDSGSESRIAPTLGIDVPVVPAAPSQPATIRLTLNVNESGPDRLPQIGLGWSPHGTPLSEQEFARLRDLSLSHLSCELHLGGEPSGADFSQAAADAARLGVPLDVAVFVSGDAEAELAALVERLAALRPHVVRWHLHHENCWSTSWTLIEAARRKLAAWDPRIPVGGGSRANFLELNRNRPPAGLADFVAWPVHPQEHSFDDASLFETVSAQRATVESARQFADGRPLVVGPITLNRRVNPYATGPAEIAAESQPPARVDRRQLSLFGAAWTLGSLKHLAEAGAAALTYFDTLGWLGVMERESGSPLPESFPSLSGAVYPLYFVLADAGEMKGAAVVPTRSSDPLSLEALALRDAQKLRLMIANPTGRTQPVSFECRATRASLRTLDETNALEAMRNPQSFRNFRTEHAVAGTVELRLSPYSYTCLDLS